MVQAVASASSWAQVTQLVGLAGGSSTSTLKGHALRLGVEVAHLAAPRDAGPRAPQPRPQASNLRRAGSLLATAWFELCGHEVAWPLEPCRYDLLVRTDAAVQRVQVKTTTVRKGASWTVWLSTTGKRRTPYDPDDIDAFFVIDGDLNHYLIPIQSVGGLTAISLSAYQQFRLPQLGPAESRSAHLGAVR